jgi:hypothetical protein
VHAWRREQFTTPPILSAPISVDFWRAREKSTLMSFTIRSMSAACMKGKETERSRGILVAGSNSNYLLHQIFPVCAHQLPYPLRVHAHPKRIQMSSTKGDPTQRLPLAHVSSGRLSIPTAGHQIDAWISVNGTNPQLQGCNSDEHVSRRGQAQTSSINKNV